jgi:hypothetical protein
LDDWHRAETLDHECGGVLRSAYLGVSDCEHCRSVRALWASFRRRTTALDAFEMNYATVDSRHGLWLDFSGWRLTDPASWGLNVCGPVGLGRPRRLRNARGENLVGAARILEDHGRRWWAFPWTPRDGDRMALSHYVEPQDAHAMGIVEPSRQGFRLTLYYEILLGGEADRAVAVQLPATAEIIEARPAPDFVGVVHERPTVMWRSLADYPRHPVIRARWRGTH